MILIQLHSINQEAQEYHPKWNSIQIHICSLPAWFQKEKFDGAPKDGIDCPYPLKQYPLLPCIGEIKMKVYMILFSVHPDILLSNIFLEMIPKSYSHEPWSKCNVNKNTQGMNCNYQIQSWLELIPYLSRMKLEKESLS